MHALCPKTQFTIDAEIIEPLFIDVSTGDIMIPDAMFYASGCFFNETYCSKLWEYDAETVMSEKNETILSRGPLSARPRDYYD